MIEIAIVHMASYENRIPPLVFICRFHWQVIQTAYNDLIGTTKYGTTLCPIQFHEIVTNVAEIKKTVRSSFAQPKLISNAKRSKSAASLWCTIPELIRTNMLAGFTFFLFPLLSLYNYHDYEHKGFWGSWLWMAKNLSYLCADKSNKWRYRYFDRFKDQWERSHEHCFRTGTFGILSLNNSFA